MLAIETVADLLWYQLNCTILGEWMGQTKMQWVKNGKKQQKKKPQLYGWFFLLLLFLNSSTTASDFMDFTSSIVYWVPLSHWALKIEIP